MGGISWCIVGGESGPHARDMELEWAVDLKVQCEAAGVPFFMKQLGSVQAKRLGLHHPHGGDPREWPYEVMTRLYKREWPHQADAPLERPDPLAGVRSIGRAF